MPKCYRYADQQILTSTSTAGRREISFCRRSSRDQTDPEIFWRNHQFGSKRAKGRIVNLGEGTGHWLSQRRQPEPVTTGRGVGPRNCESQQTSEDGGAAQIEVSCVGSSRPQAKGGINDAGSGEFEVSFHDQRVRSAIQSYQPTI